MATMNFGGTVAAQAYDVAAPISDPVRYFPDPALEAAVRAAVGVPVGDIHQSDLDLVTTFNADGLGIVNLTGMEHWTTLTSLSLADNEIIDISALSTLTSLVELYLGRNNIVNMSPITNLTSLINLDLGTNAIVNIPDVSGLISLELLYIDSMSLVDISPLASLTTLKRLAIHINNISDISDLASLINLEYLDANQNSISDISALASLTNLTYISLYDNDIIDISPIAMTEGEVYITGNPLNVAAYSTDIPALQLAGVTVDFDAEPTPTVTDIDPASGTTAGGTPVTITGTNFLDGATATIDGEPCTDVVFVDSTSLTAVTPAGTAGAKDVVVTNDVEFGTLAGGYTYTA